MEEEKRDNLRGGLTINFSSWIQEETCAGSHKSVWSRIDVCWREPHDI